MWKEGVIGFDGKKYKYHVKIEGGRVTVFDILRDGDSVACYDLGWIIEPKDEATKMVIEILKYN